MNTIKPGLYRHYGGNLYQVIGLARHSETLEEMVVYQSLNGDYGLWTRPYGMFVETTMLEGQEVQRFEFLGPAVTIAPSVR